MLHERHCLVVCQISTSWLHAIRCLLVLFSFSTHTIQSCSDFDENLKFNASLTLGKRSLHAAAALHKLEVVANLGRGFLRVLTSRHVLCLQSMNMKICQLSAERE